MIILIITYEQQITPILQLQWYYKKDELQFSQQYDYISENEVFETTHTDYASVYCLNGKCDIISLEQYDGQRPLNLSSTFFTRAKYDVKKQKIFDPPVEKWPRYCICSKPINPDLTYISCDKCFSWFHIACTKIDLNANIEEIDFICWNCLIALKSKNLQ
eukprot:TRINITY_DN11946_c0_g1_i1.p1 TRINITY_DN11946_c0_g1~~TRINITY_DN11946_c0_g1_i1.p1  ORF type:complete len:160 (+),score=22.08 TRINITY_DN11946_c0_g1_i1:354-833(+)